jgi:hypothetical protein
MASSQNVPVMEINHHICADLTAYFVVRQDDEEYELTELLKP